MDTGVARVRERNPGGLLLSAVGLVGTGLGGPGPLVGGRVRNHRGSEFPTGLDGGMGSILYFAGVAPVHPVSFRCYFGLARLERLLRPVLGALALFGQWINPETDLDSRPLLLGAGGRPSFPTALG